MVKKDASPPSYTPLLMECNTYITGVDPFMIREWNGMA